LRLYTLSNEINNLAGTGATRVAMDASNFTINNNMLSDLDRRNRILDHIRSDAAAFIASCSFSDADKLRVVSCPLKLDQDWTSWSGGTLKKIYQNPFDNMLMAQMTSVSYRLSNPATTITLAATDSDSVNLIDSSILTDYIFDQSKETQLVFAVDRDIASEDGKTDSPYEEITLDFTSADLASGYNAVQVEFGLPMTITSLGYGATPTALTDENGDSLTTESKYLKGLYGPVLEDITRRTIFVTNPSSNRMQITLRSSHWIPWNDGGIVKKRFLFPIYNIDCIDYYVTSGTSYGLAKVMVPNEITNPASDGDLTFYGSPTLSRVISAGVHMYPQFLREESPAQINLVTFSDATAATAIGAAKVLTNTAHTISGAAQDIYVRLQTTSGTYIPRIEAVDIIYEIS
tara:strand:+ start:148 stop:1356 length:1209 start_codon:yes stop_codon:yes gene_type:complete